MIALRASELTRATSRRMAKSTPSSWERWANAATSLGKQLPP